MATTIQGVTTKERLHRLVDALTEREAEETLRYISSQRADGVDEWGDLRAMTEFAATETLRRLAEEERAAGFPPWEREGLR